MIYPVISYLKFLLKSTSEHGIHSPFVFDFVTKCLNTKYPIKNTDFKKFNTLKKNLLNDHTSISITDYGSGSKHFKSNKRLVSEIAKYAGITNKKAKLLLKILIYFKPQNILEIGTSIGLSTSLLAHSSSQVITLEGCKNTLQIAKDYLSKYSNIIFELGEFKTTLPSLAKNNCFDLIYFDGNHTKEATLKYFNLCLDAKHNNSIFIFDDIYLNKSMQEAWIELIKHPLVSVSIDIFHYGLVFFRKEQDKQHFLIRANS
jgi:predicted O-methyltransferase YrrM